MGWFLSSVQTIKDATSHDPIACPRGWGEVSFVGSAWFIPPMIGIDRKCPIGGVNSCGECSYASNPDPVRLTEQLTALQALKDSGTLSPDDYAVRRTAVVRLHQVRPGRGAFITACVLTPIGVLLALVGTPLGITVHAGFWAMAGAGAILLAVSLSFWLIARSAQETEGTD